MIFYLLQEYYKVCLQHLAQQGSKIVCLPTRTFSEQMRLRVRKMKLT